MGMAPDYIVEVRDRSFTRLGQVAPEFLDLKFTEVFRGVGAWQMKLPAEHPLLAVLKEKGSGIVVTQISSGQVYSGRMQTCVLSQDAEDPTGTWVIDGVDDNVIGAATAVLPNPAKAPDDQDVGYWNFASNGETVMKAAVSLNAGPNATAARKYPWLTIAPDQNRGATVSASARFDLLGDLLNSLGTAAGLGFRFAQVGDNIQFEVFQPTDKSKLVQLDIRNGGLESTELGFSAPTATSAYVMGQGQGADRTVRVVTNDDASTEAALWGLRWETVKDQRNTDDPDELQQAGEAILSEGGATVHSLKVTPADAPNQRLGVDWGLGDIITVNLDGSPAAAVVTEIATSISSAGIIRQATVGDPVGFDWEAKVSSSLKSQDTRISTLERLVDSGVTWDSVKGKPSNIVTLDGDGKTLTLPGDVKSTDGGFIATNGGFTGDGGFEALVDQSKEVAYQITNGSTSNVIPWQYNVDGQPAAGLEVRGDGGVLYFWAGGPNADNSMSLRVYNTGRVATRDGQSTGDGEWRYFPFAQAAGVSDVNTSFPFISFPSGRFTKPPVVIGQLYGGASSYVGLVVNITNVTKTGFQARHSGTSGTVPMHWTAIQMTPTNGAG